MNKIILVNSKRPNEKVIFEKLQDGKYVRTHKGDLDGHYYFMNQKEYEYNIFCYLEQLGFYRE